MVKGDEIVDSLCEEWMALFGKHEVIGHSNGDRLWEDDGVDEQRVERTYAPNIEVEIDATVVVENKVADGVCSLDGVRVVIEGVEEPRIVLGNEVARLFVCPEHVLTGSGGE
jgi:hypothetical protein